MSNQFRYRSGDIRPVFATPDITEAIEIGDLCYLSPTTGKPRAAKYLPAQTNEALTQDIFSDLFLGVAMGQSRVGDALPICFATAGDFDFDCAAASFALGQIVGVSAPVPYIAANQTVKAITGSNQNQKGIGVIAKQVVSPATTLVARVRIKSTVMDQGLAAVPGGALSSSSGA